ncbi:uncharacterized protein E0L32_011279 [Thyridium curvatum]|uniref:RING-type domain-containing protein n=1 Tax=Thyridium curvatum TaxID=1093900 RepID=A0A507B793_9PEZI|nr:uncharacterized protein E0L32_011279 [Thyridium curvatum]TPX19035.1 hypothetical protein E0L32_011279 [Thyridium curvatum]
MATEHPAALPVRLDISPLDFTLHWPYARPPTSAPATEAGGVGNQGTDGLQSTPPEPARVETEPSVSAQNNQTAQEADSETPDADDEEPDEIHYWWEYLDARKEGCSFVVNCPICSKGLKVYGTSRVAGTTPDLEDAFVLHCGHFVGVDCMDFWMQDLVDEQAVCPMCRASLIHQLCGHLAASKIKHPERAHFDVADIVGMISCLERFGLGEAVPGYCLDCRGI